MSVPLKRRKGTSFDQSIRRKSLSKDVLGELDSFLEPLPTAQYRNLYEGTSVTNAEWNTLVRKIKDETLGLPHNINARVRDYVTRQLAGQGDTVSPPVTNVVDELSTMTQEQIKHYHMTVVAVAYHLVNLPVDAMGIPLDTFFSKWHYTCFLLICSLCRLRHPLLDTLSTITVSDHTQRVEEVVLTITELSESYGTYKQPFNLQEYLMNMMDKHFYLQRKLLTSLASISTDGVSCCSLFLQIPSWPKLLIQPVAEPGMVRCWVSQCSFPAERMYIMKGKTSTNSREIVHIHEDFVNLFRRLHIYFHLSDVIAKNKEHMSSDMKTWCTRLSKLYCMSYTGVATEYSAKLALLELKKTYSSRSK